MKELLVQIHKDFTSGAMGEWKVNALIEGTSRIKGQYWLSSGTALGMFRDDDFTEGDTDIDVGMIGYDGIRDDILKWFEGWDLIQDVFYNGKPQQVSFRKNDIIFEFVIYWLEGNEYVQVSTHGRQTMPKEVFEKLVTIECQYGKFPLPEDYETYFNRKIGHDWKIPKQSRRQYDQI